MYEGQVKNPQTLTAAAVLERNLLVTITNRVPAYTAAGGRADGVTDSRGDDIYRVPVTPIKDIDGTHLMTAAAAIAVNGEVFAAANGKIVGVTATAKNRSEQDQPSVDGTYIVPDAGWSTGVGDAKQIGVRATTWVFTTPTAGNVVYLTQEAKYVAFDGTNWVDTVPVGKASEAASADGAVIAVYTFSANAQIARSNLPTTMNHGAKIVLSKLSASETDADAAVTILDARILAGDIGLAAVQAATTPVSILKVAITAGSAVITLSGNGGAGTIVGLTVFRSLDA